MVIATEMHLEVEAGVGAIRLREEKGNLTSVADHEKGEERVDLDQLLDRSLVEFPQVSDLVVEVAPSIVLVVAADDAEKIAVVNLKIGMKEMVCER